MIKRVLLCFICILIIPLNAYSDDNEITIGFAEWPPYEYMENGEPTGVNVTIVNGVGKLMGIKFKFIQNSWGRCMVNAKSGKIDAIMSLYKNPERETFLYFPDVNLSVDENILITYHKNDFSFNGDLNSLTGKTVIVVQDNSYGEQFDKAENFNKHLSYNSTQTIKLISENRIELGIVSRFPFFYIAGKHNQIDKIKILTSPGNSGELYVGFAKAADLKNKNTNLKNLAEKFSGALNSYKNSDEYKSLMKMYGF